MNKLAPSVLAADFTRLGEQVALINRSGAEYIHLDVMDGNYVPNISFGPMVINAVRGITDKKLDVHLMIEDPMRYLKDYKEAGADTISVHAEACKHLHRTITEIKEMGMKASVALSPETSINILNYLMDDLDMVLVMTVNPGFGGQSLIEPVLDKVKRVRKIANDRGRKDFDIEVDGGVTLENLDKVLEAGANVIVAGTAIFKGDMSANLCEFEKRLQL